MIINGKICTARLYLRSLRPSDVGNTYAAWFKQKQVNKYIENPPQPACAITDLRNYVAFHNKQSDSILLGVFSKANDIHIGNIKFEPINYQEGKAVLGVLIGDINWRGSNVFGEIFKAAKLFLYEKYEISEFLLGVESTNIPAITAYKKAGFVITDKKQGGKSVTMSCIFDISKLKG